MDYLKTAAKRGIYGIFIGVFIGQIFVLIAAFTNETMLIDSSSYILNFFASAIVGYYCVAISICYDVEEWSLLRQTVTHALLILPYLFIAYYLKWTPQGLHNMMIYIVWFIVMYAIIWYSIKRYWQKKARELNALLEQQDQN